MKTMAGRVIMILILSFITSCGGGKEDSTTTEDDTSKEQKTVVSCEPATAAAGDVIETPGDGYEAGDSCFVGGVITDCVQKSDGILQVTMPQGLTAKEGVLITSQGGDNEPTPLCRVDVIHPVIENPSPQAPTEPASTQNPAPVCVADSDCTSENMCQEGLCVTRPATNSANPGQSEPANETPAQCSASLPCPEGQVCNAGGQCEVQVVPDPQPDQQRQPAPDNIPAGGCTSNTDCAAGQECANGQCSAVLECGDASHPERICDANHECQDHHCVALPACGDERHPERVCGTGLVCREHVCIAPASIELTLTASYNRILAKPETITRGIAGLVNIHYEIHGDYKANEAYLIAPFSRTESDGDLSEDQRCGANAEYLEVREDGEVIDPNAPQDILDNYPFRTGERCVIPEDGTSGNCPGLAEYLLDSPAARWNAMGGFYTSNREEGAREEAPEEEASDLSDAARLLSSAMQERNRQAARLMPKRPYCRVRLDGVSERNFLTRSYAKSFPIILAVKGLNGRWEIKREVVRMPEPSLLSGTTFTPDLTRPEFTVTFNYRDGYPRVDGCEKPANRQENPVIVEGGENTLTRTCLVDKVNQLITIRLIGIGNSHQTRNQIQSMFGVALGPIQTTAFTAGAVTCDPDSSITSAAHCPGTLQLTGAWERTFTVRGENGGLITPATQVTWVKEVELYQHVMETKGRRHLRREGRWEKAESSNATLGNGSATFANVQRDHDHFAWSMIFQDFDGGLPGISPVVEAKFRIEDFYFEELHVGANKCFSHHEAQMSCTTTQGTWDTLWIDSETCLPDNWTEFDHVEFHLITNGALSHAVQMEASCDGDLTYDRERIVNGQPQYERRPYRTNLDDYSAHLVYFDQVRTSIRRHPQTCRFEVLYYDGTVREDTWTNLNCVNEDQMQDRY